MYVYAMPHFVYVARVGVAIQGINRYLILSFFGDVWILEQLNKGHCGAMQA